jgi:DNA-binding NarL/FixJ family response regulator
MLRILLADDHDVVRRGLRDLLTQHDGWQVCGEATTGRQAVEMAVKLTPNIAILDLTMPQLNGLDATRQIKKAAPSVEVLIFTMHESEQLIREVLAAGARGYLLKSDASRHIVAAVESLARHRPFFTWKASETMLESFLTVASSQQEGGIPGDPLTVREREILQLLAEGNSSKKISAILGISVKTVDTHRATIMRKLDAHSIVDVVHYAIRNNLVRP